MAMMHSVLVFEVEVTTTEDDGLDVLAHSLSGELIQSLTKTHKVTAHMQKVLVDGRDIYDAGGRKRG